MNSSLTENRASDGWATRSTPAASQTGRLVRDHSAPAHLLAFGLDAYHLSPLVAGRRRALWRESVRRGAVRGPAGPVRLAGCVRVISCAAVLVSINPVVASGEWSSPVDQDHPGDLWPGSWTSVFFGVTPAASPGVVVAVEGREHCVTGTERQDETFGRLNPEHLVGRVSPPGEWLPSASAVIGVGIPRRNVLVHTSASSAAQTIATDRLVVRFCGAIVSGESRRCAGSTSTGDRRQISPWQQSLRSQPGLREREHQVRHNPI